MAGVSQSKQEKSETVEIKPYFFSESESLTVMWKYNSFLGPILPDCLFRTPLSNTVLQAHAGGWRLLPGTALPQHRSNPRSSALQRVRFLDHQLTTREPRSILEVDQISKWTRIMGWVSPVRGWRMNAEERKTSFQIFGSDDLDDLSYWTFPRFHVCVKKHLGV